MQVYRVTADEANALNRVNYSKSNTLLIVCDYGDHLGVDPAALQAPEYADFLVALGGVFLPERVVEVQVPEL